MPAFSLRQKLSAFFSAWGPASMSYGLLSGAQALIGASMPQKSGWLMIVLALLGVASVFVHKGKTFDEVRALRGAPLLALPWSCKATHVSVCVCMVFLCSSLPSSGLMSTPALAYPAALLSVLGGWMASLTPGKNSTVGKPD